MKNYKKLIELDATGLLNQASKTIESYYNSAFEYFDRKMDHYIGKIYSEQEKYLEMKKDYVNNYVQCCVKDFNKSVELLILENFASEFIEWNSDIISV